MDGAFGLWAAAVARARAPAPPASSGADSWATDAHKWLNVPYDSGLAFCRDAAALRAAMASPPPPTSPRARSASRTSTLPELSRRARGVEVWAALRSLGRDGPGRPDRAHLRARPPLRRRPRAAGYEILNDVVLNQVLVSFGTPERPGG